MSEHVRLGGSKAHRFLVCLASPRLEQEAGEQPAGEAALDGTTAHHVAERCLMLGCEPTHPGFLDAPTVMGRKVTMEMAESVQVYVDWARNLKSVAPDAIVYYELPVTLARLDPPEDMRGSADLVALFPSLRRMIVADYKHGIGHRVEVTGNRQVRYYALAALLSLPREQTQGIEEVQLTIIQPRIYHPDGPIRSETIHVGELIDFAEDLLDAARRIQQPDAPAVPGTHCLFCNASATCKARADYNVVNAQEEFDIVVQPRAALVDQLSIEELAALVQRAEPFVERAQAWLKDAKERLFKAALGGDVPGYKLVAKRATRVWKSEEQVVAWAKDRDLLPVIYEPPVLKSPAQIEGLVGKKGLPADLYEKISSGFNLAPADSSKPAARLQACDEFSTVEPSELDAL